MAGATTLIAMEVRPPICQTNNLRPHYKNSVLVLITYLLVGYLLPNDEDESDRLDMAHALCLKVMEGKLYLAPIGPSPERVIDLATGTGIWAIDFGKEWDPIMLARDVSDIIIQPTSILPQR